MQGEVLPTFHRYQPAWRLSSRRAFDKMVGRGEQARWVRVGVTVALAARCV